MAAPNTLQKGYDVLVKLTGNTYAGRKSVTLSQVADMLDITDSVAGSWREVKPSAKSWTLPLDGMFVEGSTKITGCPTVKVAAHSGTLTQLSMIKSAKLSASTSLTEVQNCSSASTKKYLAGVRSVSIDLAYDFLDPNGTGSNQAQHLAIIAAYEGGSLLDLSIEVGVGTSFTMSGYVSKLEIVAENDSIITVNTTIEVSGSVTRAGTLDVGIEELLDAMFDTTQEAKAVIVQNTSASGSVKWSGSAWASQIGIEFAFGAMSKLTGTLAGEGALTRATV